MSAAVYVRFVFGSKTLKGGGVKDGIPGGMYPVRENGWRPFCNRKYEVVVARMIAITFLPKTHEIQQNMNNMHVLYITDRSSKFKQHLNQPT